MLGICWYCDSPIDVDESTEGQAQIHKDCLLELATGGAWDAFTARAERQKETHLSAVASIDRNVQQREIAILAVS